MTNLTVPDSSRTPINRLSPKTRTCTMHLGITKPSSLFSGRWVILLSFPETCSWTAYYSDGSCSPENPYDWKYVNGFTETYDFDFSETRLLGPIEEERFRTFLEAFYDTVPGPDQFFSVRLVHALGKRGLVEQGVVKGWLSLPSYSVEEREFFKGKLSEVDARFYGKEVVESGFCSRGFDGAEVLLAQGHPANV
ncbi:uncharacterized protein BDV14DRAFT_198513 [Aspergillus stella-maris]|uniref:uncharacterized protein n=1 Tax=Aspergillus stella-maris TaxID=1810926 RepID=UPI003CCD95FF